MEEKKMSIDAQDNILKMVANLTLIIPIIIGFFIYPFMLYFRLGDIDNYYFFSLMISYLVVLFLLFVFVIPFRRVLLNYRVGFYRISYKNLEYNKGRLAVEGVLKDMGKTYNVKEKFIMSRIYRDVGTLIKVSDYDLMIIIRIIKVNSRLSLFSVRIGKICEENESFAIELRKRLDTKLKEYIR